MKKGVIRDGERCSDLWSMKEMCWVGVFVVGYGKEGIVKRMEVFVVWIEGIRE